MPAFLLPLLASAAPGLAKTAVGLLQGEQAKKLKPENYVPPGFQEALDLQRQAAGGGMPGMGQQLNRLNQGVATATANAVRTGSSPSSILGTIAGLDANRNDALSNLAVQEQQYRAGQQGQLTSMLGTLGKYQQQSKTDYDRSVSALREARLRNVFSGLEGMASAGAYALSKLDRDEDATLGANKLTPINSTARPLSTGLNPSRPNVSMMRALNPYDYLNK